MVEERYSINELREYYEDHVIPYIKDKSHKRKLFSNYIISLCEMINIKINEYEGQIVFNKDDFNRLEEIFLNIEKLNLGKGLFYSRNEVIDRISKAQNAPLSFKGIWNLEDANTIRLATISRNAVYFYKEGVDKLEDDLNNTVSLNELLNKYKVLEQTVCKYAQEEGIFIFKNPAFKALKNQLRVSKQGYTKLKNCIETRLVPSEANTNYMEFKDNRNNAYDLNDICAIYNKYIMKLRCRKIDMSRKKLISSIKIYFKALNINYTETEDNLYISEEDGKRLMEFFTNFNLKDYYTIQQVSSDSLLNMKNNTARNLNPFTKGVPYRGRTYYKKSIIDYFAKMRKETINASKVKDMFGWSYINPLKVAVSECIQQGMDVELIAPEKHPFGGIYLLRGYEQVIEHIKLKNELLNCSDRYEEFKIRIRSIRTNNNAPNTLELFHSFIIKRFEKNKTSYLPKNYAEIYKILVTILNKELDKYSKEEMELFIEKISLKGVSEEEFYYFLNYYNKQKKKSLLPTMKYNKSHKRKKISGSNSFTRKQWDKFAVLVFGSISKREMIFKAYNSRKMAMCWLYFALHFVTALRKKDMMNLPKPRLELIGFQEGTTFLTYLKNDGVFTDGMGETICKDIQFQMRAYGKDSSKNGIILPFIVGESLVKPVGLLLAICEAHRQTVNTKFKTWKLIGGIVTHRETHLELFGDEYIKIFGEVTFGNLKATNTTALEISEEGGANSVFLFSVLRGHASIPGKPSATSANIYMTHGYENSDAELGRISFNMLERGIFSSAPYIFLEKLNSGFVKLDYEKQTAMIKQLGLSPYEIENISKSIIEEEVRVRSLFNKILKMENTHIREMLEKISLGKAHSKHHYAQCLLRAMTISDINEILLLDTEGRLQEHVCIMEESSNCIGCPFIIFEKLFLIELSTRLEEILYKLSNVRFERDKQRLLNLLVILKNILKEAVVVLGKEKVSIYVSNNLLVQLSKIEKSTLATSLIK